MAGKNPAAGQNDGLGRDMILRWRDYFIAAAEGGEDIGVALGSLVVESGGDPCATGGDLDGDGVNDEIGISQHNTSIIKGRIAGEDGQDLGFTVEEILAACHADGSPPTDAEMRTQAAAHMALLRNSMGIADAAIAATGVNWGPDSEDYWALVKQSHAGGKASVTALELAVADLGTDISYAQFREHICATIDASKLTKYGTGPGTLHSLRLSRSTEGTRNRLEDTYQNAMRAASYMSGERGSGLVGLLNALLGAAVAYAACRWGISFVAGKFTAKGGAS